MQTTATDLRSHLYRYLDRVAEQGETIVIERGGVEIEIRLRRPLGSKLDRIVAHPEALADPEAMAPSPWDEAAWHARWRRQLDSGAVPARASIPAPALSKPSRQKRTAKRP